jgi:hypothetical protein
MTRTFGFAQEAAEQTPISRTIVEINGVDATDAMDKLAEIDREKKTAKEAFAYLLDQNFERASKCTEGGEFKMAFGFAFSLQAGRTEVKAKVRYARAYTEGLELFAQHQKGNLFDRMEEDNGDL